MGSLASVDLYNITVQALCCAGNGTPPGMQCAICPNQDLAGIGVRFGFYIQSFLGALLVIFSPEDSSATTWGCTLFTTAVIIAGVVSKAKGNLTLHHAVLVLNFATLSAISSLAVAPLLSIWRLSPAEYCEQQERRHAILPVEYSATSQEGIIMNSLHHAITSPKNKKRAKRAQMRARLVISMALLIQVGLQWTWGIYLFVSPNYAQPDRSASTVLMLFWNPYITESINELGWGHGGSFWVWPAWIMFSLSMTLGLVIYLVRVGSAYSQDSDSTPATALSSATPIAEQSGKPSVTWSVRDVELLSITVKAVTLAMFGLSIFASERQIKRNAIFPGENSLEGLGQIVAIIVCLTPFYSLVYALYKYPARRRRWAKSKLYQSDSASSDGLEQDYEARAGGAETASLLVTPHTPMPSRESSQSDALYGESIELRPPLDSGSAAGPLAFPALAYQPTPSSSTPPRFPVAETHTRVFGDLLDLPMHGVSQRLYGSHSRL